MSKIIIASFDAEGYKVTDDMKKDIQAKIDEINKIKNNPNQTYIIGKDGKRKPIIPLTPDDLVFEKTFGFLVDKTIQNRLYNVGISIHILEIDDKTQTGKIMHDTTQDYDLLLFDPVLFEKTMNQKLHKQQTKAVLARSGTKVEYIDGRKTTLNERILEIFRKNDIDVIMGYGTGEIQYLQEIAKLGGLKIKIDDNLTIVDLFNPNNKTIYYINQEKLQTLIIKSEKKKGEGKSAFIKATIDAQTFTGGYRNISRKAEDVYSTMVQLAHNEETKQNKEHIQDNLGIKYVLQPHLGKSDSNLQMAIIQGLFLYESRETGTRLLYEIFKDLSLSTTKITTLSTGKKIKVTNALLDENGKELLDKKGNKIFDYGLTGEGINIRNPLPPVTKFVGRNFTIISNPKHLILLANIVKDNWDYCKMIEEDISGAPKGIIKLFVENLESPNKVEERKIQLDQVLKIIKQQTTIKELEKKSPQETKNPRKYKIYNEENEPSGIYIHHDVGKKLFYISQNMRIILAKIKYTEINKTNFDALYHLFLNKNTTNITKINLTSLKPIINHFIPTKKSIEKIIKDIKETFKPFSTYFNLDEISTSSENTAKEATINKKNIDILNNKSITEMNKYLKVKQASITIDPTKRKKLLDLIETYHSINNDANYFQALLLKKIKYSVSMKTNALFSKSFKDIFYSVLRLKSDFSTKSKPSILLTRDTNVVTKTICDNLQYYFQKKLETKEADTAITFYY